MMIIIIITNFIIDISLNFIKISFTTVILLLVVSIITIVFIMVIITIIMSITLIFVITSYFIVSTVFTITTYYSNIKVVDLLYCFIINHFIIIFIHYFDFGLTISS
jgi:hypothetical protein